MGQVIEAGELRLEAGRNCGVHIAEEEDDIISENARRSLQPHFFHLKCTIMQITQIADAVLEKLLSLLQLATNEYEASVIQTEPDEIGAFVRQDCIIVGVELQPAVFHQTYIITQLPCCKNLHQVSIGLFFLDGNVTFFIDRVIDQANPFVLLREILDAYYDYLWFVREEE